MLVALKASIELKVHVREVLRNGCTEKEIQAVLSANDSMLWGPRWY